MRVRYVVSHKIRVTMHKERGRSSSAAVRGLLVVFHREILTYRSRGVSTLTLAVWTALHSNEGRPENLEQAPNFVMKIPQK